MNQDALIELMETLSNFGEYTYFRDEKAFLFRDLSAKQFAQLYNIISKYNLQFNISHGLKIML